MSVMAIICEYNPFHNGHLYHMYKAQEAASISNIVCLMSGSMVQRGEPAILDKWARATMALASGADLVVELPTIYATGSARRFARGAIRLLMETEVVSHLAFGIEARNQTLLIQLAEILSFPPPAWEQDIKVYLSHGLSYATARLQATLKLVEKLGYQQLAVECRQIMSSPNNILGLEYLTALNELGAKITPILITRQGEGYHSLQANQHPSATFLRQLMINGSAGLELSSMLPSSTFDIITDQLSQGRGPVTPSSLDSLLIYRLRSMSVSEIDGLPDVESGMGARIKAAADIVGTREQLRHKIKTKRYVMTRIDRILLYSLLNITRADVTFFDSHSPNYLRVLGCSSSGQKILHLIRRKSELLLINRVRPALKKMQLSAHPGTTSLAFDIAATDLQTLLFPNPEERWAYQDFTHSPLNYRDF